MGTISDKLTYLTQTKEAIKNKIALYSVDISTGDTFRSYVDKIEDLIEFYANEPLPYIKRTLNNNGSNLNVYESPFIKIYATDHNSYTIDEWIEVVKTDNHPNPLGLDIKALGQHFVILFFGDCFYSVMFFVTFLHFSMYFSAIGRSFESGSQN